MARQIQLRRGTATEHENFIGAVGELTMDTTNKTLRLHDGVTVGGIPMARADGMASAAALSIPDTSDCVIETQRPTAENNYTWYRKYKSGAVDMGGEYSGNATTVQLPVTLKNADYTVQITKNSSPEFWATTHLAIASRTSKDFTVAKYGDSAIMKIGWVINNAVCA